MKKFLVSFLILLTVLSFTATGWAEAGGNGGSLEERVIKLEKTLDALLAPQRKVMIKAARKNLKKVIAKTNKLQGIYVSSGEVLVALGDKTDVVDGLADKNFASMSEAKEMVAQFKAGAVLADDKLEFDYGTGKVTFSGEYTSPSDGTLKPFSFSINTR